MPKLPVIPSNAPFTAEQRAWLNGYLAGLFSNDDNVCVEPRRPRPDRPDRPEDEPGRNSDLERFLRDNAERVYFVDGMGQYLP